MPPKSLNQHQKAVQEKITNLIQAAQNGKLKGELIPLKDYFVAGRAEGITARAMATEIVSVHPLFKGHQVNAVTTLIEQVIAEKSTAG